MSLHDQRWWAEFVAFDVFPTGRWQYYPPPEMFSGKVLWQDVLEDVSYNKPPAHVFIYQPDGSVVGLSAPHSGMFCMDYKMTFPQKKVLERRPPKDGEMLRYEVVMRPVPPAHESSEYIDMRGVLQAAAREARLEFAFSEASTRTALGLKVQSMRTQRGIVRCGSCNRPSSSFAAGSYSVHAGQCDNICHVPWHSAEALQHLLAQPDGFVRPHPDSYKILGRSYSKPFPPEACEDHRFRTTRWGFTVV